MNSLSVWAWMFLFGHVVWATGFMFLIFWREYWQELIETESHILSQLSFKNYNNRIRTISISTT
ncbi:Photosystem I [Bertholletia excelsa]